MGIDNNKSSLDEAILQSSSNKTGKFIVNGVLINNSQKIENNNNGHGGIVTIDDYNKFPKKTQFNDVSFTVLFVLQMILFFGMMIYSAIKFDDRREFGQLSLQGLICIGISIPLILIFFQIWKKIFKIHPVNMIKVSYLSLVIMGVLGTGLLIGNRFYWWGLTVGLFTVYIAYFYFAYKHRIELTGKLISVSLTIIEKYCSLYSVSFISLLISCLYWNVWLFTWIYYNWYSWTGSFFDYAKSIFLIFNLYWTHYVITYSCYSVVSGVVASWYFFSGENFENMPVNPCLSALCRSMTTSFGSISFGSLIVCLVALLQRLFRMISRIPGLGILCGMMACMTCWLNRIIYTFNIYTFSIVAIYGRSFCDSSKKTYQLMVDDNGGLFTAQGHVFCTLLSVSISMTLIIGFIVSMLLSVINVVEYQYMVYYPMVIFMFMINKPFDIVYGTTATISMCLISDPKAMELSKPSLYNQLVEY